MISERPAEVETRGRVGHWEADTVAGAGTKDCVATLVERKTGLVLISKLSDRTADSLSRRLTQLIRGADSVETVTADNVLPTKGKLSAEAEFSRAWCPSLPSIC